MKNCSRHANLCFYCVNTSYPLDNCFTGRRDQSRQTTEKFILYKLPAGPVTECTFARCRLAHTSCLDRMTSSRLFRLVRGVYRRVLQVEREDFLKTTTNFYFIFTYKEHLLLLELLWHPLDRREVRVGTLWLFLMPTPNVHVVVERVLAKTCVEKKACQICDNFSEDQKKQLATPTYRAQKDLQKKASSPSQAVDPAIILAKSFQVPVEPVKMSDVVVTDRPFIPPTQQSTGVTGEKQSTSAEKEVDRATQPVQVPGAVLATRPVEAPGAALVTHTIGQESSLPAAVDRPEVQPPGPATQPATVSKQSATSCPGSVAPVEEPAVESDQFSDRASSLADEGEVSDLESTGPDREELLDVDQELTAEQTYRETLRGVRSFMAWNDIPEFDS